MFLGSMRLSLGANFDLLFVPHYRRLYFTRSHEKKVWDVPFCSGRICHWLAKRRFGLQSFYVPIAFSLCGPPYFLKAFGKPGVDFNKA